MADSTKPAKAVLQELDSDLKYPKTGGRSVVVQFNPETLKLSFANQIATPPNGAVGDQGSGTAGRQFVGTGTTKLSLQIWFDVNALMPKDKEPVDDVRKLTQEVLFFITPQGSDPKKLLPPGVRFMWGAFSFDGLMDSVEETIEFFSTEGKALRASMSLGLSQQKILKVEFTAGSPGSKPLTPATAGETVQGLADSQGKGGNWQAIAAANNIENPRLLQPGQLLDLNVPLPKVSPQVGSPQPINVSLQIFPRVVDRSEAKT